MGKKKYRKQKYRRLFKKKKRSIFSRPNPMRRKMMLRRKKMRAFVKKYNPRPKIEKSIRKMVGGIYDVSDKVRDKIAEIKYWNIKKDVSEIGLMKKSFNKQLYKSRETNLLPHFITTVP